MAVRDLFAAVARPPAPPPPAAQTATSFQARWAELGQVRLRDRYEQHKADFFADIPTTGPTSSEPEQDPAARLLPRPA
jgi:hypothetical protein